jgi:hypothetical protein
MAFSSVLNYPKLARFRKLLKVGRLVIEGVPRFAYRFESVTRLRFKKGEEYSSSGEQAVVSIKFAQIFTEGFCCDCGIPNSDK